jgi:uncharacterized protein YeaO (DUF488 family)
MFKLKRAYEEPETADGARYLVDRLCPRGITKAELKIDGWIKEVAPSNDLRRWFNHDPAKWDEFRKRYFTELDANRETWKPLVEAAQKGTITLLYGAHDPEHNNAVALAEYLKRHATRRKR